MKKYLLCLAAFLLSTSGFVHAQTLLNSGQIEGGISCDPHIVKAVGGANGVYVVGWFRDSLDLDPSAATTQMVYGNPGQKTSYLAHYTDLGMYLWGFSFTHASTDSTVATDVDLDFSGNVLVPVTYTNTISVDPLFSASSVGTTGDFASILLVYNANTGQYVDDMVLQGTAGSGAMINEVHCSGPDIYMGGWITGTVDMNDDTPVNNLVSTDQRDAFVVQYSAFGYTHYGQAIFPSTAGNEEVRVINYDDGLLYVGGVFDNNIELDFSGSGTSYTSTNVGTTDIFLAKVDALLSSYYNGFVMGGNSNDRPIGMENTAVLIEFQGTINIDPLGTSATVTSAGSTDVVIIEYNATTFHKDWYFQYGNAGADRAHFLISRGSSYYISMSFSGTINAGGNGAGPAITAINNPVNGIVIELDDSYGDYIENYRIEAQTCKAFIPSGNNPNDIFTMGEFSGSAVDVMPFTGYNPLTTTFPAAGYMLCFNRCHITMDAVQQGLYECGSCSAILSAHYTGSIGAPSGAWSYSGSSASGITVSGMCPGEYFVTLTDYHGCDATDSVTVLEHPAGAELDVDIAVTNSSCNNNVGTALATVYNAMGDIQFNWSNGDTLINADSLSAGFYTLTVSDTINCYVTQSFSVNDVDGPSVSLTDTTHLTCSGVNTGAIDITVTGGAAPLTFLWSNGATTEDLSGIPAGTYAVIVTDANGCQAQLCVTVNGPAELEINLLNIPLTSACGATDGSLVVAGNGGTAPYTYQWDAAAGSSVNDTVTGLGAGIYEVTVTDAGGCITTNAFGLSETGGPYVGFLGANQPSCTGMLGGIFMDIPDFTVSSIWNTGDPGPSLYDIEEGGKYFLTATDLGGCITIFEYELGQTLPNTPDLCMVTVDVTNTKNVVIWDKTTTPEAVSYNIYREGFCSSADFLPIGNVDADSLSIFEDTVVNTSTRSWKYYVTALDSCGFESLPSEINKTIHLTALATPTFDALLNWEAYIGREVAQYDIFRVDPIDPTLYVKIDSVDGSTLSYTDTTNFNGYVNHDPEWYVEAVPVNPCFASRAFNQNASRSNHTRLGFGIFDTTGVQQLPAIEDLVKVYPNPANDRVNISVSGLSVSYTGVLLNHVGQTIRTFEMNRSMSLPTGNLPQGIYYLRIANEQQQNKVYKLVIAH